MNSEIFSRSFLQGLPDQRKQRNIDQIIHNFIRHLKDAAESGKTSYMYIPGNILGQLGQQQSGILMSNDDLVLGFQKRFPDCNVSYKETWIDVKSDNKVLRKGIVIDWS